MSVLDEKGKLKITEVEKSGTFTVIDPISNVDKCIANCKNVHRGDHYSTMRSPTDRPPKTTLNSSTVSICELGEESFSDTGDDEEYVFEDDTSSTHPDNAVIDGTKTTSYKQVANSFKNTSIPVLELTLIGLYQPPGSN